MANGDRRRTLSPEDAFAVEQYNTNLQTLEARARSAESAAHVLMGKAYENDAYQKEADQRVNEMNDVFQELEELRSNPPNFEDKSGTRPAMADVFGNFSKNARVANAGGIGIEGSNSTEDGTEAEDPEDAGVEMDLGPAIVHGRGGRAETMAGTRVVEHPDDESAREAAAGEEETTSPRTRRRRRAAAKKAPTGRRAAKEESEE